MTKIKIKDLNKLAKQVVLNGPGGPTGASPEEKFRHFAAYTCLYALMRQMQANIDKKGATDVDVLSAASSYMMYWDGGEINLLCTLGGWPQSALFDRTAGDYPEKVSITLTP